MKPEVNSLYRKRFKVLRERESVFFFVYINEWGVIIRARLRKK